MDGTEAFDRDKAAAKYLDRVQGFARKLVARYPALRDDAEGESLVALTKALNNYRGGDFQTYLMQVVRSRVTRLVKRHVRQQLERPAVVPLLDTDQTARVAATRALSPDTVAKLRDDPQALKAVELVCCESWSHREAALLLGCSKAQVGALLKRAAEAIGPPGWDKV